MVIAHFETTSHRPEEMRVRKSGAFYRVETQNQKGHWITQKTHTNEHDALIDCVNWYL